MKLGSHNCPHCGNLYAFIKGSCAGVSCKVTGCEVGFVTSHFSAFKSDMVDYTCYVERLPENWLPAVAWLGNRFNIPVTQARAYKDDTSLPLITRKAAELFYLRQEFDEHRIEIRIEPEFKYTAEHLNPDGEYPLSDAEMQVIEELISSSQHL